MMVHGHLIVLTADAESVDPPLGPKVGSGIPTIVGKQYTVRVVSLSFVPLRPMAQVVYDLPCPSLTNMEYR